MKTLVTISMVGAYFLGIWVGTLKTEPISIERDTRFAGCLAELAYTDSPLRFNERVIVCRKEA